MSSTNDDQPATAASEPQVEVSNPNNPSIEFNRTKFDRVCPIRSDEYDDIDSSDGEDPNEMNDSIGEEQLKQSNLENEVQILKKLLFNCDSVISSYHNMVTGLKGVISSTVSSIKSGDSSFSMDISNQISKFSEFKSVFQEEDIVKYFEGQNFLKEKVEMIEDIEKFSLKKDEDLIKGVIQDLKTLSQEVKDSNTESEIKLDSEENVKQFIKGLESKFLEKSTNKELLIKGIQSNIPKGDSIFKSKNSKIYENLNNLISSNEESEKQVEKDKIKLKDLELQISKKQSQKDKTVKNQENLLQKLEKAAIDVEQLEKDIIENDKKIKEIGADLSTKKVEIVQKELQLTKMKENSSKDSQNLDVVNLQLKEVISKIEEYSTLNDKIKNTLIKNSGSMNPNLGDQSEEEGAQTKMVGVSQDSIEETQQNSQKIEALIEENNRQLKIIKELTEKTTLNADKISTKVKGGSKSNKEIKSASKGVKKLQENAKVQKEIQEILEKFNKKIESLKDNSDPKIPKKKGISPKKDKTSTLKANDKSNGEDSSTVPLQEISEKLKKMFEYFNKSSSEGFISKKGIKSLSDIVQKQDIDSMNQKLLQIKDMCESLKRKKNKSTPTPKKSTSSNTTSPIKESEKVVASNSTPAVVPDSSKVIEDIIKILGKLSNKIEIQKNEIQENTTARTTKLEKDIKKVKRVEDQLSKKIKEMKMIQESLLDVNKKIEENQKFERLNLDKLKKLEGKIEILSENLIQQETVLSSQNDFLVDLEKTLLKDIQIFEKLNIQKQGDVYESFHEALLDMSRVEKTNLLSMLTTLSDSIMASLGVLTSGANNQLTERVYYEMFEEGDLEALQLSVVELIEAIVLKDVDLEAEDVELQLQEGFQNLQNNARLNLTRLFTSFFLRGETLDKEIAPSLAGTEWRNILRNISNLVAYMMRTSSYLTKIYQYFVKEQTSSNKQGSEMKNLGIKFAKELFSRHKNIVSLLSDFSSKGDANIESLNEFCSSVAKSAKEELEKQRKFLDDMKEIYDSNQ